MIKSVSILLPTHNRSALLARALESLTQIRMPDGIEAELIVVANACTDATETVVAKAAERMPMPTRCVAESKLGLNVARNRCGLEATGDVLAFLDDDVWVEPDWLVGLCGAYENDAIDVVGGRALLWWADLEPPPWMDKRFEVTLSGCDHGEHGFEIDTRLMMGMVGANFSFTREVWSRVGHFKPGLDRVGHGLLGGGETEFLRRARNQGFRFFYAPLACVRHLVSPNKIESSYLHRVSFDFGRTHTFLNHGASAAGAWAWGVALGQPLRAMTNFAGSAYASLTGDRVTALSRRLAGIQRLGRSIGALQLLTGRSPFPPATAGQRG